jgi:gliding motility-associated-like protein
VKINYTPSPVVNAGLDFTACKNSATSALSGTVSGGTTSGIWSGGSGNYNPSNSVLNANYSPSGAELTAGFAKLTLTSSNNGTCFQVTDTVVIFYTNSPVVNAGLNITSCKNNAATVLTGTVSGATSTGIWTGGSGVFTPTNTALTVTYTPTPAEVTAGFVNLILTSTNNGNCSVASDNVVINFYTAPSVYSGIDLSICKNNSNSILSGSVNGPTSTGIWTGGSGSFTPNNTSLNPIYVPSPADIAAGSVTLTLNSTNNGGCNQVKDSMVINFTNPPIVTVGTDLFSCKNNPVTTISGLVTGGTTTGIWTGGAGSYNPGNTSLTNTYTPSASEIAAGSVTLTLNSTNNGNCSQVRDTIIINFTNSPLANAGVDLFSCKNNSSTALSGLVSGPTTTGIWSGGSGTFNPNSSDLNALYTPSASELAVGYVNLTLTSTNNAGCNAVSDLVKLNFVAKPFANFNFNNVCLNKTTTFTDFSLPGAGTISSWEWNFGDGSANVVTQNTTHTFTTPATFTTQLVVSNSYGCYDTISLSPSIYPLPNTNFGISRICNGNLLTLVFSDSSTVSSPETINQWFWDFGGAGLSNLQNPTQLFPGSGLYNISLIATSNHNCKDTIVKQINLTPRPIAGFAYSLSAGVNVGTTVNFVDTSSYANNWSWNFGDSQGNSSSLQNPSTIYYDNGTFVVTQIVSDGYGCSDTARVAIKISNVTFEISTLIPNAISPNGDGKNDVWKLDFLSLLYPNASVKIYNRWGEEIYSAEGGYTAPWDGTYKGQLLPVSTYYYVLTLHDAAATEPFKGGILLIR